MARYFNETSETGTKQATEEVKCTNEKIYAISKKKIQKFKKYKNNEASDIHHKTLKKMNKKKILP